jgi:hypothetical protein
MAQSRPQSTPHPLFTPSRPEGVPTRGKTARNRLRRVDNFLLRYAPELIRRDDGDYHRALVVDLGYGAEPFTTLEMAQRLRRLNTTLPVLGVEIDPMRVSAAQPYVDQQTHFRLGGFNLPLESSDQGMESVRAVRAFNVLRQYDEGDVAGAWSRLGRYVLPGGLLIEGTSDPFGRVWTANLLRRTDSSGEGAWHNEGLIFSTNFRTGFDLPQFQAVLPKNYIHRMVSGEAIHDFFQAWQRAAEETSAFQAWGLRQWFVAGIERLAERGYPVGLTRRWWRHGYLMVELEQ